ncbi:MAG TPA: histidine kinase [Candidatus Pelethocola excrementipullorum]|nr:histidine kinase [Candidatus Pelethocola excrementipullorum]
MELITGSYISRRYFKRLFISFLCISIIPLALCVSAILYANYTMSIEKYSKNAEAISDGYLQKLEEAIEEYKNIGISIGDKKEILTILQENSGNPEQKKLHDIMDFYITGRENKLNIYILDVDSRNIYSGQSGVPNFYRTDIYDEWGILHKLKSEESAVCANQYMNESGKLVSLSIATRIEDENDNLMGAVIIDVYRDTLISLLPVVENDDPHIVPLDKEWINILDTEQMDQEGKLTSVVDKTRGNSFFRTVFNMNGENDSSVFSEKKNKNFYVYTFLNISDFYTNMSYLLKFSLLFWAISVGLCLVAAGVLTRKLYAPFNTLLKSMKLISQGDMTQRIHVEPGQNDEMALLGNTFNKMLDKLNELLGQVIEETQRQKNAEIKSLQAQISPHFLYNMLNEIKALAKLNRTDEIAQFVIHLGRLLRRSITYREEFCSIRQELDFVKDYLELQQIRYESKFVVDIKIPEELLECQIPSLILQPIVENSIIHGFTDSRNSHILQMRAVKREDKVIIKIYDDGVGVDKDYLSYINNVKKSCGLYGGLGVENVQKRLLLTYGIEYGIKMESVKDQYTLVSITLPYRREAKT